MDLKEFTFSLKKLNKIKKENPNIYDDGNQPDCKCPYGILESEECETICKHSHK